MQYRNVATILAAALWLGSGAYAAAQGQHGGGQGGQTERRPAPQQPGEQARDMARDQAKGMDRDQARDMARDQAGDMQRDMDRDRDQLRDQDVYGHELMSAAEMQQYRDRIQNAASERDRVLIRAEHHKEMQARAREQGVRLDPPAYGQAMMTAEEQQRYRDRIEAAADDTERARIRAEHEAEMRSRARELGLDPPDAE